MNEISKMNEIEKKVTDHNYDNYNTTPEFNKFTTEIFDSRLKRANLARRSDIANYLKKTDFYDKVKYITSNKSSLNELSKTLKQYQQKY